MNRAYEFVQQAREALKQRRPGIEKVGLYLRLTLDEVIELEQKVRWYEGYLTGNSETAVIVNQTPLDSWTISRKNATTGGALAADDGDRAAVERWGRL